MEHDVGEFLRTRRARIQPEEVGLRSYSRRRVPGLRREELAQLAGVSADYYVRLEQGRGAGVSDSVLDAIGNALRLDRAERAHLRNLIRPSRSRPQTTQLVRPGVQRLLESMANVPAFVLGRRMDVLAWNAMGAAVNELVPGYNAARQAFLDQRGRELYPDWRHVAAETVAYLRLDAGRHPHDPALTELIDELSAESPEFVELWNAHDVMDKTFGRKLLRHPLVGELDLAYETLILPGDADQLLVAYTAEAGSVTADRLAQLAETLTPARRG